jgi:hypothetical protein
MNGGNPVTANICPYCHAEMEPGAKTSCQWCSQIIQEANCIGVYLVDVAVTVGKRDDLVNVDARRAAIQAKFDQFNR